MARSLIPDITLEIYKWGVSPRRASSISSHHPSRLPSIVSWSYLIIWPSEQVSKPLLLLSTRLLASILDAQRYIREITEPTSWCRFPSEGIEWCHGRITSLWVMRNASTAIAAFPCMHQSFSSCWLRSVGKGAKYFSSYAPSHEWKCIARKLGRQIMHEAVPYIGQVCIVLRSISRRLNGVMLICSWQGRQFVGCCICSTKRDAWKDAWNRRSLWVFLAAVALSMLWFLASAGRVIQNPTLTHRDIWTRGYRNMCSLIADSVWGSLTHKGLSHTVGDQLHEDSCMKVHFSGGNPPSHPPLLELQHIIGPPLQHGMIIHLSSGTRVFGMLPTKLLGFISTSAY